MAGCDVFALLACEGGGIDGEDHGDRGLVHGDARQGHGVLGAGDGVADVHALNACQGHDVACEGFGCVHPLEALELKERCDLGLDRLARLDDHADGVARPYGAVEDAADGQPPYIVIVIDVRHEDLERCSGVAFGFGDRFYDQVEKRPEVLAFLVHRELCQSVAGVGVDDGELELFVRGVEVDEKVIDLVHHLADPRVRPVDLVDHEDRRQAQFQGLFEHEPRLGQGALRGVDEQKHAVHHLQRAFHFAAKVRMARRVHDVDLRVLVPHGRVLGHDGDAPLPLQVDIVHDPFLDPFIVPEGAALAKQGVHERGLAVVNVGDDGDVSDVFFVHGTVSFTGIAEVARPFPAWGELGFIPW